MVNLINQDTLAMLLDNDGDRIQIWDHPPTEAEIAHAIEGYRYKGHTPFTLFLAARKEVWEYDASQDEIRPYKIFEQTNEVIKNSVQFGKRRVVVR
jgi:hypothetical protein